MFLSRPAPMRALLSASRSLPLTTSSTASILVAGGAPARFSSTTATVASNTHTGTNHASASVPLSATAAAAAAAVAAASAPRQKLRYSGVASHRAVSSPHRDYLERTIRVDHAGELGALRIYQVRKSQHTTSVYVHTTKIRQYDMYIIIIYFQFCFTPIYVYLAAMNLTFVILLRLVCSSFVSVVFEHRANSLC